MFGVVVLDVMVMNIFGLMMLDEVVVGNMLGVGDFLTVGTCVLRRIWRRGGGHML